MGFNITSGFEPDRIRITTDTGARADEVKTYTGWVADLAIWAGFAKKIQDSQGKDYVVNLRSLGKAWAHNNMTFDTPDKVKDEFAKHFFNQVKRDHNISSIITKLNNLFKEGEGAFAQSELRRLRELPTAKPYLNTTFEKEFLYRRIKDALLTDFPSLRQDSEWRKKIDQCFPDPEGMQVSDFEKLIKELNQIELPKIT